MHLNIGGNAPPVFGITTQVKQMEVRLETNRKVSNALEQARNELQRQNESLSQEVERSQIEKRGVYVCRC